MVNPGGINYLDPSNQWITVGKEKEALRTEKVTLTLIGMKLISAEGGSLSPSPEFQQVTKILKRHGITTWFSDPEIKSESLDADNNSRSCFHQILTDEGRKFLLPIPQALREPAPDCMSVVGKIVDRVLQERPEYLHLVVVEDRGEKRQWESYMVRTFVRHDGYWDVMARLIGMAGHLPLTGEEKKERATVVAALDSEKPGWRETEACTYPNRVMQLDHEPFSDLNIF